MQAGRQRNMYRKPKIKAGICLCRQEKSTWGKLWRRRDYRRQHRIRVHVMTPDRLRTAKEYM